MTRHVLPAEWTGLVSEPETAKPGNVIPMLIEWSEMTPVCDNCWNEDRLMLAFSVKAPGTARAATRWFGTVRLFGNLVALPCPVCAGDWRQTFLEENCGLGDLIVGTRPALDVRMSDFRPMPGKEQSREMAGHVLADLTGKKSLRSFCITGGYGTGKTMLLAVMINAARLANIRARYTTAERMLQDIRETFNQDVRRRLTDDVINEWCNYPVLAIDELDRANFESRWVATQYFEIVNRRMSSKTLTLLASNQNLTALQHGMEPLPAMASRMTAGLVCEIGGEDLRPRAGARLAYEIEGD